VESLLQGGQGLEDAEYMDINSPGRRENEIENENEEGVCRGIWEMLIK